MQSREAQNNRAIVDYSATNGSREPILRQYSRITLAIDDISDAQSITTSASNASLRSFDIVAVCPGTQQILSHLCKEADVDIISFDFTHRNTALSFNKKLVWTELLFTYSN